MHAHYSNRSYIDLILRFWCNVIFMLALYRSIMVFSMCRITVINLHNCLVLMYIILTVFVLLFYNRDVY